MVDTEIKALEGFNHLVGPPAWYSYRDATLRAAYSLANVYRELEDTNEYAYRLGAVVRTLQCFQEALFAYHQATQLVSPECPPPVKKRRLVSVRRPQQTEEDVKSEALVFRVDNTEAPASI